MNYYNPYFSAMPYSSIPTATASRGLLSGLFGGGKLSSFISGTQKTLGIINQAIPLVKQISPVMKNAKTMFKVMNEFKRVDTPDVKKNSKETIKPTVTNNSKNANLEPDNTEIVQSNSGPTFFL